MMYSISILRSAQKELAKLPPSDYEHICQNIEKLGLTPRPTGCKKLIARPGWRIRVGHYRVIYEVNDTNKTVLILHIGHRKDVYL